MRMKILLIPAILILSFLASRSKGNQQQEGDQNVDTIDFYYLPGCPFCQNVEDVLIELGFEYNKIDVSKQINRQKMMSIRHNDKTSAPFVVINGRPMDESTRIIRYLRSL